jgi:ABC-type transporter Mla subunit MlaD
MTKRLVLVLMVFLAGCETAYYNAMEKVGIEKRDILVDRIEDTQEIQQQAQEQFRDALQQYRAVVEFDGGNLEKLYDKLNREYQDSEQVAAEIAQRIRAVEDVAGDLFREWERELKQIKNAELRQDSYTKLRQTQARSKQMIAAMWRAEKSVQPVLDNLRDQVLYLKHNLNARAIASLKGELRAVDDSVNQLIYRMQQSINEANRFVATMQ